MSARPDTVAGPAPDLLPGDAEAPRCADHNRAIDADPGGTGLAVDLLVIAEVPLPWPKPVGAHPVLAATPTTGAGVAGSHRILAAVPRAAHDQLEVRTFLRRSDGSVDQTRHRLPDADAVAHLLGLLATTPPSAWPWRTELEGSGRALLVCTQGSHDVCCGTHGTRLATTAEAMFDDIEVFRVSHTGGHRFAPTAMTLPDGRMWAYLDPDILAGIIGRTIPAAEAAPRCRGWWGAPGGPAQVAERAVFAQAGWHWDQLAREVEEADGAWLVRGGGATWRVEVDVERILPVIACRQPGGLPVSPCEEFAVTAMQRLR